MSAELPRIHQWRKLQQKSDGRQWEARKPPTHNKFEQTLI